MIRRGATLVAALLMAACSGSDAPTTGTPGGTAPPTPPPTGGTEPTTTAEPTVDPRLSVDPDAHSALELPSVTAFGQLAATGVGGQQVVKFSITNFLDDATVEWLDSNFYTLHDEWYWFQLLNGHPVAGFDVEPVTGLEFDDVAAVYEWAERNREALPLDLQFTSLGRLYSSDFYDAALDNPAERTVGVGSLIRVPARADPSTPERWLLELEYSDRASAVQIERYFRLLIETLPAEIGDELLWVPRSREQEIVAEQMAADGLPYGDRTIRFDDLVVPGDIEVYAEGVAAGRVLFVTDDGRYSLSDAGPDDIVAVERTPDALPPGNGLITGSPQTPLAHVNVLALNRGIPNAFLGGLALNPELSQLGRVRAPVAIRAVAPDQLDILVLTDAEFAEWNSRRGATRIAVPPVDVASLSLTMRLNDVAAGSPSETEIDAIRPAIGGKAAGFLGLAAPGTVTTPDEPLVITVRAYFEHIAQLEGVIDSMLTSTEFSGSARARFLLLEGREDFEQSYTSETNHIFVDDFVADHPDGSPLGDIVAAGGLKQMIRDLDIDPATLAAIESELAANFALLSPAQGLRFRSSSSVEDIEGFNGAGLYSSNTGFLDPTVLPDAGDHDRTAERAIKRTWSSYWNVEAVEERRYENVDHRSGGMAVLVHARFDDPLEVSNGVATFTVLPDGGWMMQLNAQAGDTSVTNPTNEPGQAPEVVQVRQPPGDEPVIERLAASTLVGDGDVVLADDKILDVWAQLRDVTLSWLDRVNADLRADQQITTLTLDFEFREMDGAWPALASGGSNDEPTIVVKQARTLEPGLRAAPAELLDLAIPRDVLARATRADRVTCPAASGSADTFIEVYTDPLAAVDLGYAVAPLTVAESGSATRLIDDSCTRQRVFSSADDYLQELFASRDE